MRKFIGIAVLAAMLAVAMASAALAGDVTSKEAAHLAELNRARQRNNVTNNLEMSEILTAAAKVRAEELSRKFSHERPDGRKCYTAIDGWSESDTRWIGLAENIASGKSLNSAVSAVTLLMTSAGHRSNILNSSFNYVGLANYVDDNGEYFWVQIFSAARPSGDTHTPQGSDNEVKSIRGVDDKKLTKDNVWPGGANTVDLFTGASAGSVRSVISPLQNAGKYTLLVSVTDLCANAQVFMKEWDSHDVKMAENSLMNADYFDIVLLDTYDAAGREGNINSWMKTLAPSVINNWKNARYLYAAYNSGGRQYFEGYNGLLLESATSAKMPTFILYKDNMIIAYADGIENGVNLALWANYIADLRANAGAASDTPSPTPTPTPTDGAEVIGDAQRTWNGTDMLSFTVNSNSQIKGVRCGNRELTRMLDYTLAAGAGSSKVITFTTSFLSALSVGSHDISVDFEGASALVTIVKPASEASPAPSEDPNDDEQSAAPSESPSPSPSVPPSTPPSDDASTNPSAPADDTSATPPAGDSSDNSVTDENGEKYYPSDSEPVPPANNTVSIDENSGASVALAWRNAVFNGANMTLTMNVGGVSTVVDKLYVLITGPGSNDRKRLEIRGSAAIRAVAEANVKATLISDGRGGIVAYVPPSELFEGKNLISITGKKAGTGEGICTEPVSVTGKKSASSEPDQTSKSSGGCDSGIGSAALIIGACAMMLCRKKAA